MFSRSLDSYLITILKGLLNPWIIDLIVYDVDYNPFKSLETSMLCRYRDNLMSYKRTKNQNGIALVLFLSCVKSMNKINI